LLDLAVLGDIVEKTGAWYSYDDVKIGQGRENAKTFLSQNEDILDSINKKVVAFMGLDKEAAETES